MHLNSVPKYDAPIINLMGKSNSLLAADYTEQWEGISGLEEGTGQVVVLSLGRLSLVSRRLGGMLRIWICRSQNSSPSTYSNIRTTALCFIV